MGRSPISQQSVVFGSGNEWVTVWTSNAIQVSGLVAQHLKLMLRSSPITPAPLSPLQRCQHLLSDGNSPEVKVKVSTVGANALRKKRGWLAVGLCFAVHRAWGYTSETVCPNCVRLRVSTGHKIFEPMRFLHHLYTAITYAAQAWF